ncbi:S-adenosylmethionine--tRNA ribosyltransferase-isomerase [Malonomonas rubra DSM 5091]|uniref:S-adenosylmethionine:tRNA ribosyltransferase-isomerase n=1 Tax=Malonomonas rubra DSM 5091 TaxID=1122189 RepID=A0A1M6CDZ6_MALRU|nr:tRNA preQ1(34) S-adenosylmethionine ribosyltransferase-isomerase QueA [Malonomonas rubra]SHI59232.1 S-adenosylmethionine--tRNA ribosyltransferase-isomerase [Malonomonas rubra DSM 5091]
MQLTDFDFLLPEELIAQQPAARRDASRLMSLERQTGQVTCGDFSDLPSFFRPGDLLVLNDTQVIPARLLGQKLTGGKIEIFLVRRDMQAETEDWFCLTKSSRAPKPGAEVLLGDKLRATVLEEAEEPYRRVRFECDGDFMQQVEAIGHLPLPPYIKREDDQNDRSRYQTVFAREKGAVAAPTAGLHFTPEVLDKLRAGGVEIHSLTLHVGLGTFLPVRVDDVTEHKMHSEFYNVPQETADAVNKAKLEGRRVFALGTTSARTLETAATDEGMLQAGCGESDIFIYPGYRFKIIDALITNFHLPKSTLLMLVSAFAGREFILSAYRRAVEERFRFFSYGDCMLIY